MTGSSPGVADPLSLLLPWSKLDKLGVRMGLVRIRDVVPLEGFRLRLTLTDGRVVERDVAPLLVGPIFEPIRSNHDLFLQARVQAGTVVWPNGADLCPDVLIWNGPPPAEASSDKPETALR